MCSDTDNIVVSSEADSNVAIGNQMLRAIQENDYSAFVEYLSAEAAKAMTPEAFQAARNEMTRQSGEIISFEYMGELQTPLVRNFVYRVTFCRNSEANEEPITQDLMFRLLTGEIDGKIQVISFSFL